MTNRVTDFLKIYSSNSTIKAYKYSLRDFFKSTYGENEKTLDLDAEKHFKKKRNHEEDLQNFLISLNGKPPKSVKLKLSAVKSFLIENDIELKEKFWRRLLGRVKGSRAVTLDKIPSSQELKKIIMHLPIQGKALYLTLASSGMRIGEALKLTPEDLELNRDPGKINIRAEYTKTGNSRIAFISREAKEQMLEWLENRIGYLETASGRSFTHRKNIEDENRVFPFESNTAYYMWETALNKANLNSKDKTTERTLIHPHVLRKFFRTKMGAAIPIDIAEALMGHEGYLTEVYRRHSEEQLADFYNQGEHSLLIFTEAGEVTKLKQEVQEQNKQLQTLVNGLTAKNMELEERLAKTENAVSKMLTKYQSKLKKN